MEWTEGRKLAKITYNNQDTTYEYNHEGLRIKKTLSDGSYILYDIVDGVYVGETRHNASGSVAVYIRYILDESNSPVGISLWYPATGGWTDYHFIKNLQGDVLEVYKVSDGSLAASYTYDSWGNILSQSGDLATLNPFRYRSYYYDTETWFYYLQSRYYDPAIGRFINADAVDLLGANGDFASLNLFAYCGNNPLIRADDGGELWHLAFGSVVGGVISGTLKLIECVRTGDGFGETVGQVLVSAACGAIGGALAATGIGVVGQAMIGGTLGTIESAVNQFIDNGSIDRRTLLTDAASGVLGGISGGNGASCGSKFMSYHRGQFLKNISTEGFDSAINKLSKHTRKWAKQHLREATRKGITQAVVGNKIANYGIQGVLYICDRWVETY